MPGFAVASADALLPVPPVEECIDRLPLPDPPVPLDPLPALELPVPPCMTLKNTLLLISKLSIQLQTLSHNDLSFKSRI